MVVCGAPDAGHPPAMPNNRSSTSVAQVAPQGHTNGREVWVVMVPEAEFNDTDHDLVAAARFGAVLLSDDAAADYRERWAAEFKAAWPREQLSLDTGDYDAALEASFRTVRCRIADDTGAEEVFLVAAGNWGTDSDDDVGGCHLPVGVAGTVAAAARMIRDAWEADRERAGAARSFRYFYDEAPAALPSDKVRALKVDLAEGTVRDWMDSE